MTSPSPAAEDCDLRDAAIADAAARLGMLRRLADLGMKLAEEVVERAVGSPYHPEPKQEPCRAFATVSRSVRLTLVLQEKVEMRLIALRNGAALLADGGAAAGGKRGAGFVADLAAADDTPDDAAPDDAANGSDRSLETLREREGERFDELAPGVFNGWVGVVRAGLGLKPSDDVPLGDAGVRAAVERVPTAASPSPVVHGGPVCRRSITGVGAEARGPPDSG